MCSFWQFMKWKRRKIYSIKPNTVQEVFEQCPWAHGMTLGDAAVQGLELHWMILVGPFQPSIWCGSVICLVKYPCFILYSPDKMHGLKCVYAFLHLKQFKNWHKKISDSHPCFSKGNHRGDKLKWDFSKILLVNLTIVSSSLPLITSHWGVLCSFKWHGWDWISYTLLMSCSLTCKSS